MNPVVINVLICLMFMGCNGREITQENIRSLNSEYDKVEILVKDAANGNIIWTIEIGIAKNAYYKKWDGRLVSGDEDEQYAIEKIFMNLYVSYFDEIDNIPYGNSITSHGDKYEIALISGNETKKIVSCYNPHAVYSRDAIIINSFLNNVFCLFKQKHP